MGDKFHGQKKPLPKSSKPGVVDKAGSIKPGANGHKLPTFKK